MNTTTIWTTSQHGTEGLVVKVARTDAAEAAAQAFLARTTGYEVGQQEYRVASVEDVADGIGEDFAEYLFPTCSHGMSLQLCMGPDHFMSADQERAMGW